MTQTSARVLLDSITREGCRLTTFEVTFHRFVLAEFNTHRKFSRNSASSRAIPVEKQLDKFIMDLAFPLSLPAEQPGMQGGTELEGQDREDAKKLLLDIQWATAQMIGNYLNAHPDKSTRLHKSILNRPMEWGQWHTVIVTSTEWENFFAQRCSPLAQPEIREVANLMRDALDASRPTLLLPGDWHTPLILGDEVDFTTKEEVEVSAARCARVSYLTHEGIRSPLEDFGLFDRLAGAEPPHWSPMEHVATPLADGVNPAGNFDGWGQLRHNMHLLEG